MKSRILSVKGMERNFCSHCASACAPSGEKPGSDEVCSCRAAREPARRATAAMATARCVFVCRNRNGFRNGLPRYSRSASKMRALADERLLAILPCAQQAAQEDQLAEMVRVVVGYQKRLAEDRLAVA